jgi:hypothetical protein
MGPMGYTSATQADATGRGHDVCLRDASASHPVLGDLPLTHIACLRESPSRSRSTPNAINAELSGQL